ncbi:DUF4355 domain-containing protein [Helcococcus bovis]|uniref:DUF4355 domain-containing protein n=1 Tax=Helcococcus bovis TaxID=3153252 RepID=UPI0038BDFD31
MEENTQVVDHEVQVKDNVDNQEVEQKETTKEAKAYTQEELDKIIKSNVDRAVAKARREAEEKQEEAKKLAKMNADQKAEYERDQRESKLAERERAVEVKELKATAKDILTDKGLPLELHEILNYENAETVNQSIEAVEKAVQKAVEIKVSERLKGNPPRATETQTVDVFTQAINNKYKRR